MLSLFIVIAGLLPLIKFKHTTVVKVNRKGHEALRLFGNVFI